MRPVHSRGHSLGLDRTSVDPFHSPALQVRYTEVVAACRFQKNLFLLFTSSRVRRETGVELGLVGTRI